MTFLSVLLVLALVQWWGSGAPLQKDGWFSRYIARLDAWPGRSRGRCHLLLAVLAPTLLLWLLCWWLARESSTVWILILSVPVLLYSLGRGDFSAQVGAYSAANQLERLQGAGESSVMASDWGELHRQALRAVAYRSCERMFAVIFWFLVLGPAGALMYRLSVLYRERLDTRSAARWLWLLEWPVVRLLGLTWAMAGNFDSCFPRCQNHLTNRNKSSAALLYDMLLGALGRPPVSQSEVDLDAVRASQPLFSRSLLLWVSVLALITLLA